ncbi:hypothetical protein FZEAL_9468 [Fusarium zealandicum]|uniref:Ser/arg-related nuclear matrix protein n=1 Tax=Fusarium zealandicum TaxID=1053134 RepID=A0A8H4UAS6_9HYPO|nr:hypothetical protein FZEAL_9468 [Fusarium zealandicum]
MGESFDIQNLLQTGYFTTSRAKSPKSSSSSQIEPSSYTQPAPAYQPPYQPPSKPPYEPPSQSLTTRPYLSVSSRVPRVRPPPPTVEDEEVSLRREHGSFLERSCGEEAPSRGDIDQNPVIMEVHEYNPERRFVILTGSSSGSDSGETERKTGPKTPRFERAERPERFERQEKVERSERPGRTERPERPERVERPERTDRAERTERIGRNDKPPSDAYADSNAGRRYDTNLKADKADAPANRDRSRPPLEKRRSRQDLPRLETEFKDDKLPEKYRTRPSAAASSRPDQPPVRPPKVPIDPLLAPEVIKHSAGGREKPYHNYGQPQSARGKSPTRLDGRRYDEGTSRGSSTASSSKRSRAEPEKPTRPLSKERVGEPAYRGDYTPIKSGKKERSPPYGRTDREDHGRSSTYPSRDPTIRREDRRDGRDDRGEDNRSGDDHPKGPRELHQRRRKSVIVQDERDSQPKLEKVDAPSGPRLRPRGPTMPLPIPVHGGSGPPDDFIPVARPASTFPISNQQHVLPERPKSQLPYPIDDEPVIDPLDTRGNAEWLGRPPRARYETDLTISMPEIPMPIAISPESPLDMRSASALPIGTRPPPSTQPWQPPAFDPNRDGVRLEKPVGSVRRHSEHAEATGITKFPECRRKHPVAGLVDWLTLPRSEFNICPECYGAVFAKTEHRHPFQPMLRPSDRPISCDFGVGPWYRIAWLLTLKNNLPDLRLFHGVANVMTATQNQPCPGDRTTMRNWLTLWNPYTRQLVHDFTVCPQCAKIIQALLPNLTGSFIPHDSRSEPVRGLCSMRFKPKRKRFVMYFDAMETASDQARLEQEEPDITTLAQEVDRMAAVGECQEDTPIANGYWHTMQYLRQFTVCGECFDEVVKPLIKDDNVIARNFYMNPQRLPLATCQLYSPRMREIFRKACRLNDPKELEKKVLERMDMEADIHDKLARLDRSGNDEEWVDEEVDRLIRLWKRWE